MDDVIVELRGVAFSYGAGAFSLRVDELSVGRGEHTAFVGASGCGKTTLINLIAGILVPDEGEVVLAGERISSLAEGARRAVRIRRIGMMFQELELLEYLPAIENILLGEYMSGRFRARGEAHRRAEALAAGCGISHVLKRLPRRLSQGERQRVALCRALATSPELVICDEPTGNLDPRSSGAAMDLLFEQAWSHGATLLVVTHDHGMLDRFDRVVEMETLAGVRV